MDLRLETFSQTSVRGPGRHGSQGSDDNKAHIDIAARRIRIRADNVRRMHQGFRVGSRHTRQRDFQGRLDAESAQYGTDTHAGSD